LKLFTAVFRRRIFPPIYTECSEDSMSAAFTIRFKIC